MTLIIVTGTPGTGKSLLAKKLSLSIGYTYFNVASFIKKAGLSESYDRKRQTWVVDTRKLTSRLLSELKGNYVVDSHLSHYLPSSKVRLCIVARTDLKTLKRRLQRRGYPPHKVRENLDAEIFNVCGQEAREQGHRVLEFDTTAAGKQDYERLFRRIKAALREK